MAELVQDGVNGLLFPAGDSYALAQRLCELVAQPGRLTQLRAGIRTVRRMTDEVEELEAIFHRIITDATRATRG